MASALGPWGFLPVVVPLFAFVAARLGALAWRLPAAESARKRGVAGLADRAVAGVVLSFVSVVLGVRALAVVHAVVPSVLLVAFALFAAGLGWLGRRAGSPRFGRPSLRPDAGLILVLMVSAAGVCLATLAARWLPVWQWDSLGYHLPFVHFTLAARGVDGVPRELEYIGTYPHDVELFFVALRACLPDDCLIDLGQIPFGLAGAVVTAALARQWGAHRETAVAAGAAWVVVPAVFLQLPTNYVDVATATFFLASIYLVLSPLLSGPGVGPHSRIAPRAIVLAGVALGLFVGSKPSAPLPAAVLFLVLSVRAARGGYARALPVAAALVVLFGAESYVDNLVRHHNPVWPIRVDLGPIHLWGPNSMREVLASGANAPHLTGPLPWRMVRSLVAMTSPPAFDMRVGGFGPVVVCALPLAAWWLARRRSAVVWVAVGSTLLCPDPAIARYVLAFPAVVLAAAAACLAPVASRAPARLTAALLLVAVLGAAQLVYAAPGLSGEGPPLSAYASMSDAERALSVGADGPPTAVAAARARVAPGEAFAFDRNMDLCDLAWDERQSYRVLFLPESLSPERVGPLLDRARVRVLAAGDDAPAGVWAATHPLQFERLSALPSCRSGTCSLFARR